LTTLIWRDPLSTAYWRLVSGWISTGKSTREYVTLHEELADVTRVIVLPDDGANKHATPGFVASSTYPTPVAVMEATCQRARSL
jgi:hypothetical protein